MSGTLLKQPPFDWKGPVKYHELHNFQIEVRNIFLTNSYKKMPININLLGHEGFRLIQTLNDNEKVKCKTSTGLFEVITQNFKLQHNDTILLLQYCKLIREEKENTEEWMAWLRVKANEFVYIEKDRRFKEQFMNDINDDMMTEI